MFGPVILRQTYVDEDLPTLLRMKLRFIKTIPDIRIKLLTLQVFIYNGGTRAVETKFQRIVLPTQDSFSRQILKVCLLGRVEAQFLIQKIVISRSMIKSLVRTRLNIIVHTRILICIMT